MKQEERETMETGMCSDKSDLKYRKEGYHIIMSMELIMKIKICEQLYPNI